MSAAKPDLPSDALLADGPLPAPLASEGVLLDSTPVSRPSVTPAQLVSGIPIIAELLHAFGVYDLSQAQQDSLGKAVTWALVLVGGDAILRVGRNLARRRL